MSRDPAATEAAEAQAPLCAAPQGEEVSVYLSSIRFGLTERGKKVLAEKSLPIRDVAQVLLERRGKVCLPSDSFEPIAPMPEAFLASLAELGYGADTDLIAALRRLRLDDREPATAGILQVLREAVGATVTHQTLGQRIAARASELAGQVSDALPLPPSSSSDPGEPSPPSPARSILALATDPEAEFRALTDAWLLRSTPLRPDEIHDLGLVLTAMPLAELGAWLPETLTVKATLGEVFGLTLQRSRSQEDRTTWCSLASRYLKTATDALRTYNRAAEADAMLTTRAGFFQLSRPIRRFFMGQLEACDPANLIADLQRHELHWKRFGERLHPFEYHRKFPRTAAAFAVLRGTRVPPGKPLHQTLASVASQVAGLTLTDGRLRFRGFSGKVEQALKDGHAAQALSLLRQRPGELMRRLDHLSRLGIDETSLRQALDEVVPKASPAVLLTCLSHFRARVRPWAKRVFIPQAAEARPWAIDDLRPPFSSQDVAAITTPVFTELTRRAAALPRVDAALLDEELRDLMVPTGESGTSKALVQLPRGSVRPLPDGDSLRLFLHWTQPDNQYVDLDLSVAFFDANWKYIEKCDFQNPSAFDGAALHSGDLTSAPAPEGATEYLDLDLSALIAAGVRHVATVVYSYNRIPFERLIDGFAGLIASPGVGKAEFDAHAVRQRFDLEGRTQILIPMLLNLERRRLRWVDLALGSISHVQAIGTTKNSLARQAKDFEEYYGVGSRPTLWELACLHAACRARTVVVRDRKGRLTGYHKRGGEDLEAFVTRLSACGEDEGDGALPGRTETAFAALIRADVRLPEATEIYALHSSDVPAGATQRSPSDLVSALKP